MNVTPGRITGLIGPNGAGKTTVINLITGIIVPTAGRVLLGDRDITGLEPHKVARSGIARTFQNIRLLREASVLDNVVVGFHRTGNDVACGQSRRPAVGLARAPAPSPARGGDAGALQHDAVCATCRREASRTVTSGAWK